MEFSKIPDPNLLTIEPIIDVYKKTPSFLIVGNLKRTPSFRHSRETSKIAAEQPQI